MVGGELCCFCTESPSLSETLLQLFQLRELCSETSGTKLGTPSLYKQVRGIGNEASETKEEDMNVLCAQGCHVLQKAQMSMEQ
jgi:hypothetical protein